MKEEKLKDDAILLKLHRQYGKDEALKVLFAEISALKFKIGELVSENEELNHTIKRLNASHLELKTAKQWQKDDYVSELRKTIKNMHKSKIEAHRNFIKFRDGYFSVLAKLRKIEEENNNNQNK